MFAIRVIKESVEQVKGTPGLAATLSDGADIIGEVGVADSLQMLRFMLELEERLSIQIDFDALEYSYLNSIQKTGGVPRDDAAAAPADQPAMKEGLRGRHNPYVGRRFGRVHSRAAHTASAPAAAMRGRHGSTRRLFHAGPSTGAPQAQASASRKFPHWPSSVTAWCENVFRTASMLTACKCSSGVGCMRDGGISSSGPGSGCLFLSRTVRWQEGTVCAWTIAELTRRFPPHSKSIPI